MAGESATIILVYANVSLDSVVCHVTNWLVTIKMCTQRLARVNSIYNDLLYIYTINNNLVIEMCVNNNFKLYCNICVCSIHKYSTYIYIQY